jgi:hypothetical protein
MTRRRKSIGQLYPWYGLAMLALESQQVIGLRMIKMAKGGPAACVEANLMLLEKIAAATQAGGQLMMGGSTSKVIAGYRRKVRANARRLGSPAKR